MEIYNPYCIIPHLAYPATNKFISCGECMMLNCKSNQTARAMKRYKKEKKRNANRN